MNQYEVKVMIDVLSGTEGACVVLSKTIHLPFVPFVGLDIHNEDEDLFDTIAIRFVGWDLKNGHFLVHAEDVATPELPNVIIDGAKRGGWEVENEDF